jgi:hypothetical protein
MTSPGKALTADKPKSTTTRVAGIGAIVVGGVITVGGLMSPVVDYPEFLERIGLRKPDVKTIKGDAIREELEKQNQQYKQQNQP